MHCCLKMHLSHKIQFRRTNNGTNDLNYRFFKTCSINNFNLTEISFYYTFNWKYILINIVAAFRGMHESPVKHSHAWLPRKCDYRTERHRQTNGRTDKQTPDKVIPMCCYALQATQKWYWYSQATLCALYSNHKHLRSQSIKKTWTLCKHVWLNLTQFN